MKLHVYTDGSYDKEKKIAGYAAIVYDPEEDKVISKISGSTTDKDYCSMRNVGGEILAVQVGIPQVFREFSPSEVTIFYDYEGIEKWVTEKWKTNKTYTKKYKDEMRQYFKAGLIKFVKVEAHTGDKYNEMADKLAKEATFKGGE